MAACAGQRSKLVVAELRPVERDALFLRFGRAIARDHRLQLGLDVRVAVAIEQVAKQAALQVAGIQKPVGDGEREVHVHVHHDPHVVMRRVMTADRVDQRKVTNEPVVAHVAAEVERLVHHVMADHADEHDIAGVRIDQHARDPAEQEPEHRKNDQHAPRKEHDAELADRVDRGVVVGEVLMMLARMAIVDGAQREDVDQPVHHEFVHAPFDEVAADQNGNQQQPFPARVL